MKTFKQFNEGLVGSGLKLIGKTIGKTKLIDIAKFGGAAFLTKKVADFLGRKKGESDVKKAQPKSDVKKIQQSKPKYENPDDGSIPGRYKDESLIDYFKRRNKGYDNQINKS